MVFIQISNGDSGSPLIKERENEGESLWYLLGITSYGPALCGTTSYPGIYTNVIHYIEWINAKIKLWDFNGNNSTWGVPHVRHQIEKHPVYPLNGEDLHKIQFFMKQFLSPVSHPHPSELKSKPRVWYFSARTRSVFENLFRMKITKYLLREKKSKILLTYFIYFYLGTAASRKLN